jgi:hypothetical protein
VLPSDVNAEQQSGAAEVLHEEKNPAVSTHSREQETKRRAPRNLFFVGRGGRRRRRRRSRRRRILRVEGRGDEELITDEKGGDRCDL